MCQNLAERFIGLLKNGVRSDLAESNPPMLFWDYCVERRVQIMNLTARGTHKLGGMNPYTALLGEHGDLSNIAGYGYGVGSSGSIIWKIGKRRWLSSQTKLPNLVDAWDRASTMAMRCLSGS